MEKKLFLTMAAAAFMLASCGNEENEVKESWNGEIRLSSSIEAQTRATHDLDKVLGVGESVHVWVDDSKSPDAGITTENLYKNNVLTVGDAGALSGETMYFPQSGNTVNIYALHTNATLTGDEFPGELTHTVAQDQKKATATAGAGYQGSDLVYAKIAGQARTDGAILLKFTHMLSKIEVVLVQGTGAPDITSAEILNTKLKAVFTPSKTAVFSVATDDTETIADSNPIAIDCGTTLQADANGSDDTKITLNEAIIVPQTLAEKTAFIRINENLIYKLPAEKTFVAGKKYRYIVTANLSGLNVVTSSITDWSPETGDNNGSAGM